MQYQHSMNSKRFKSFFYSVAVTCGGIFLLIAISFVVHKIKYGSGSVPQPDDASVHTYVSMVPIAKNDETYEKSITAMSVIVVDDKTDTVLFSKHEDVARPLASITKLMSALVLADIPIDFASTTDIRASDIEADRHVQVGEKYSAEQLWHVALIASSNSAIHALVRLSGLSEESFVARMNEKAKQLNLTSFSFVEPTGLSNKNIGNAQDVARLLATTLLNKQVYQTLQMPEYIARPLNEKKRAIESTDALLTQEVQHNFLMENIVGKTGYIPDAGYNFTVRLEDDEGHAVRIVLLGSATTDTRFTEARDLAVWIFDHYRWPDQKRVY